MITNDDILKVARECGADVYGSYDFMPQALITFARRIAAMQKEKDAGIADEMDYSPDGAIGKQIREQSDE